MTINVYNAGAYFLSALGGAVFVSICLYGIRAFTKQPQEIWNRLAFLIGCVERAVATTLILYASGHYLPQFIGAWIAFKFAAGWSRYQGTKGPSTRRDILSV
jgi:formate/nitrite transporter FocA (FNT family)